MDFQEVLGSLNVEPWPHPVLVFAEEWPSFTYAAQAFGCLDITTWCDFKTAKSKVEFLSTRLGSMLTGPSLENVAKRFAPLKYLTVLIQGSPAFPN